MVRLILIRHANDRVRDVYTFNGITNNPLSEKGVAQAKRLSDYLKKNFKDITRVISSDLKRAYQTASRIALDFNLKVEKSKEIREVNFGIFEGLTIDQANKKYKKIFEKRLKDKWNFRIPKGESYLDACNRIKKFIDELILNHKGEVIVILTHVTIIKVFSIHYLGMSIKKTDENHFNNCSVSVIDFNENKKPLIKLYNYYKYLSELK